MKDKTFAAVLCIVVALCLSLTVAHFIYAANAYPHASIIEYIAREPW